MKLNLPSTLSRFAFWLAISRSVGESIPETRSRFWGNIFILSNCFFSNSVSSVATLWWVTKYALDGDRENVLEQSRNFSKLCSFENSSKECSRISKLQTSWLSSLPPFFSERLRRLMEWNTVGFHSRSDIRGMRCSLTFSIGWIFCFSKRSDLSMKLLVNNAIERGSHNIEK